jgi:phosphoserine phosphatase RsbU/P
LASVTSPATILIVDDEPVGRASLRSALIQENYNLLTAESGVESLRLAAEALPDLILLDVMMPGMDGFAVLRELRATPALADIPVVMITALTDSENKIKGLEAGADDFLGKPFDRLELRARVRTITRLNRYKKLQEGERMRAALELAATVQSYLLPKQPPTLAGYTLAYHCSYFDQIGGDAFDWWTRPTGEVGIALADVAGHGVGAALCMASCQTALRLLVPRTDGPGALLSHINDYFCAQQHEDFPFVTMAAIELICASGQVRWASAGHEPSLWYRADRDEVTQLRPTGPLLGVLDVPICDGPTLRMQPGDLLLLVTDGIAESVNEQGVPFGRPRLEDSLRRAGRFEDASEALQGIMIEYETFCGHAPATDDRTLLLLKATG